MGGESDNSLFQFTGETYKGSFGTDLLEQYKLYVQSAENVSARRIASSRYLLTLNVALVALYGSANCQLRSDFLDVAGACPGDSGIACYGIRLSSRTGT